MYRDAECVSQYKMMAWVNNHDLPIDCSLLSDTWMDLCIGSLSIWTAIPSIECKLLYKPMFNENNSIRFYSVEFSHNWDALIQQSTVNFCCNVVQYYMVLEHHIILNHFTTLQWMKQDINQWYPAKRALFAMRKHGPFWQDTLDLIRVLAYKGHLMCHPHWRTMGCIVWGFWISLQ